VSDSRSTGDSLHLDIPIRLHPGDEDVWHALMEVPQELAALKSEAQVQILNDIMDTLRELQRLNDKTGSDLGIVRKPPILVTCSLWLRQRMKDQWQSSSYFSWPDIWGDFHRDTRGFVLEAVLAVIDDARKALMLRDGTST
jgi:hypothetical protein